jgi:nucleoside-diphosphate-sugar epimerase
MLRCCESASRKINEGFAVNVFLTGGAGFVGGVVIDALLGRNHCVHALVNQSPIKCSDDRVKSFSGGLFDDAALDAAMRDCTAVIHLVGIIAEKRDKGITFDRIHYQGTKQVVDAARRAGIRRYLHMSALGASANNAAAYLRTKFMAEQYVRGSGMDWTIFQPSLIHGPGGEFTTMELSWARGKSIPYFFMPYFGSGLLGTGQQYEIQPVFVKDVARAFAESLENKRTIGELFPIGGPQKLNWPAMHHIAAEITIGKRRPTLAIPAWYAREIARLLPAALLPFTEDQVVMSQQDNTCDLSKFTNTFGWAPTALDEAMRSYVS